MPFCSSGKFRTNAQKKRIDVWLIYRCAVCSETWNLPILERRPVGRIPPGELHAFAVNDPGTAMRHAFDLERLAPHGSRLEWDTEVDIARHIDGGAAHEASSLEITIKLDLPCRARLDGLLSRELRVARSRLHAAYASAALRVMPASGKALRAPIMDGQRVWLDLESTASWSADIRDRLNGL